MKTCLLGNLLGRHSCNIAARRPRPSQWSFTTGAARLPLPAALHRHDGLSRQQGAARRARRGQRQQGQREQKAASPRGPCPRPRQSPRRQSPGWCALQPRSSRATKPPLPPLGPAEVRGQHERLPHKPDQHDRRPQGLHAQAAAGALPADGLALLRAAAAHADGLSASKRPQTAADALRAGAGVGLHPAQAVHALRALLRRRGVGDARGVGAALLQRR